MKLKIRTDKPEPVEPETEMWLEQAGNTVRLCASDGARTVMLLEFYPNESARRRQGAKIMGLKCDHLGRIIVED